MTRVADIEGVKYATWYAECLIGCCKYVHYTFAAAVFGMSTMRAISRVFTLCMCVCMYFMYIIHKHTHTQTQTYTYHIHIYM